MPIFCQYNFHFCQQEKPFIFKEVADNDTVIYKGYCIELLKKISQLLEFNYTLYEPEDRKYGSMLPNGSWNGMVNELIQGVSKERLVIKYQHL